MTDAQAIIARLEDGASPNHMPSALRRRIMREAADFIREHFDGRGGWPCRVTPPLPTPEERRK
jgi:hypothetical protein